MIQKIIIQNSKAEEFFSKEKEEQLFLYFKKRNTYDEVYATLEETPKNVVLSKKRKSILYSKRHFFSNTTEEGKFIYNKLDKRVKFNSFSRSDILYTLMEFEQFDWLKVAYGQQIVASKFFCDSIVRDVLLGKLDNAESVARKYLKLNRIEGVDWRTYAEFLHYSKVPIDWITEHTTDSNAAMKLLQIYLYWSGSSEENDKSMLFYHMLSQAMALNVKINPKWSLEKMKQESDDMKKELEKRELSYKEKINIYGETPKFDYPCKLLSSEEEVFVDSKDKNNSIYRYWNMIKKYKYIALSFEASERFTLGLSLTEKGWELDSYFLSREIIDGSKALIERVLTDPNVIESINNLNIPHKVDAKNIIIDELYTYDFPFW